MLVLAEPVNALPGGRVERDLATVGTAGALGIAALGGRGEMGALLAEELSAVAGARKPYQGREWQEPATGVGRHLDQQVAVAQARRVPGNLNYRAAGGRLR